MNVATSILLLLFSLLAANGHSTPTVVRAHAWKRLGSLCKFDLLYLMCSVLTHVQRDSLLPHALIDRLLHQGHNVVAVGDLEITASRDLTSLHSLYNLDILRYVTSEACDV